MNVTEVMFRIKLKLGLVNLVSPIENLDNMILEIINNIVIPEFSIYCPYVEPFICRTNDLECLIKTNEYEEFLLPDFKTRKLLRIENITYDTGELSGLGAFGTMPLMQGDIVNQLLLSNAGQQLNNMMIPKLTFKYIHPRRVRIYQIYSHTKLVFDLAFEHDKSLASIPETARESFINLAIIETKYNLYDTIKEYNEIHTAIGDVNIKIDDWPNTEQQREELINRCEDTYQFDLTPMYFG
jgi:hypothetical protein